MIKYNILIFNYRLVDKTYFDGINNLETIYFYLSRGLCICSVIFVVPLPTDTSILSDLIKNKNVVL